MYENIKVGSDPEFFGMDQNGMPISLIGRIGGTKEHPKPIDDLGTFVQEDNVLVEINTIPASTGKEFVRNVRKGIHYLVAELQKQNIMLGIYPTTVMPNSQLIDKRAMVSGCVEDYLAWERVEKAQVDLRASPRRYAGGHIHVSWDNPDFESSINMVKAMDLFVGLFRVPIEDSSQRQEVYGRAGCFRFKPYGIEYRTPSNLWCVHDESILDIFKRVERAVEWLNNGGTIDEADESSIVQCIETLDMALWGQLSNKYQL